MSEKISGNTENKAKLTLIISMFIFGTIGIFVKHIPMSSGIIAGMRGLVGGIFLYLILLIRKEKLSWGKIKNNLKILLISGFLIGANWIFLFEAYNYTTVATATLCYYLAPVFLVLMSPIFLKEKLTAKKMICTFTALIGMFFVSGVFKAGFDISQIKGVIYGTLAALIYAIVIILNKKLKNIGTYEITIIQLIVAGLVVLPHAFATGKENGQITLMGIIFLFVIAIVHTGINYALYFSTIKILKAQTVAIFSYIDPVTAIFLSVLILKEKLDIFTVIGAILILGSTFVSELSLKRK